MIKDICTVLQVRDPDTEEATVFEAWTKMNNGINVKPPVSFSFIGIGMYGDIMIPCTLDLALQVPNLSLLWLHSFYRSKDSVEWIQILSPLSNMLEFHLLIYTLEKV